MSPTIRNRIQDPTDITWLIPMFWRSRFIWLHTTLSELVSGRTLGKIVVGLQVVAVDGKPARIGAIFMRNLLRVIDVFPVPLAMLDPDLADASAPRRLLPGTIVIVDATRRRER